MGRFINADAYASTGQGILGNNMFAYCGNNPVIRFDPSGTISYICFGDEFLLSDQMFNVDGGGGTVGIPSSRSASAKVIENEARYINNTSAEVVLESENIAFYRGVPVIKASFMDSAGFSAGFIIFLGDQVNTVETVQHEYGHSVHFSQIGALKYLSRVVIPSVIGYWGQVPFEEYYSQPWEYIAEVLGGVERPAYQYSSDADMNALLYWMFTLLP